jgi:hypothetical protein
MDGTAQDSVTLMEQDLYYKHGFEDGDILHQYFASGVLAGIEAKFNLLVPNSGKSLDHLTLITIVRKYLIPALPYKVNAEEYITSHNPIRVEEPDYEEDEDLYDLVGDRSVEVSLDDVVKTAQEIFNEYRSKS